MIARGRRFDALNQAAIRQILWQLRFSTATLAQIAEENEAKIQQVDYLRRRFGIAREKQPHRCSKCGAKIETAECLKCHLQAVANGN